MTIVTQTMTLTDLENLKIHPTLQRLGLTLDKDLNEAMEFYSSEAKHFNHYDRILLFGNYIIGNLTAWHAATTNKIAALEVDSVLDLEEEDLPRFINAKSLFFKRSYKARFRLFLELEHYLKATPSGIKWAETLTGNKMKEKIAFVTGYSSSTVQLVLKIGRTDDALFSDVEVAKLSLRDAYNTCIDKAPEKEEEEDGKAETPAADGKAGSEKKTFDNKGSYKPVFKEGKLVVMVFDREVELFAAGDVKETANSITYFYQTAKKDATVEVKFINLKALKESA